MHIQFFRPMTTGPINLEIEELFGGRRMATLRVTISQKGRPSVTGFVQLVRPVGEKRHQLIERKA